MSIEVKDGVISGDVHSGDVHNTNITNIHHQSENNGDVKVNWYGLMVTRNQYFSMFYIVLTLTPALLIFTWFAWKDTGGDVIFVITGAIIGISAIAYCFEAQAMEKKFSEEEAKNNH